MPNLQKIYYSPLCQRHQVSPGHPERPQRLQALVDYLQQQRTDKWQWVEPSPVAPTWFEYAHPATYVRALLNLVPKEGEPLIYLDGDTCLSAGSGKAVALSGGALKTAVDESAHWMAQNLYDDLPMSFCLHRPPGHHAERSTAMGFCLFNLLAVAVIYAHKAYGFERVAVLDFDVHHGNGTEDILQEYPQFFFASTYEEGIFPAGTVAKNSPYRQCLPMPSGITSEAFQSLWDKKILPTLVDFQPQIIFVSAGFDAHRDDPLANCTLDTSDFYFLGQRIKEIALTYQAPIIANLEGGYDLQALARSAHAFIQGLE